MNERMKESINQSINQSINERAEFNVHSTRNRSTGVCTRAQGS